MPKNHLFFSVIEIKVALYVAATVVMLSPEASVERDLRVFSVYMKIIKPLKTPELHILALRAIYQ